MWLEQDKKGPVQAYATEATREEFVGRLTRDGLAAPFCYYRALVEGVYYEQEKPPAERYKVTVPYLFISGMLNIICLPQAIEKAKEMGLTPNLTVKRGGCRLLVYAGKAERSWRDLREVAG
jgi:soluble epoxide hydrolase/lipid-phosphate phosphatase